MTNKLSNPSSLFHTSTLATFSISKRAQSLPPDLLKKQNKGVSFQINITRSIAILISLMTLVCFLYLSEFNNIATQGVIINDLERARSRLIIENEVWNMRIAQLKSMDVIEHQDVVKKMPSINPAELEFIDLDRKKGEETQASVPILTPEPPPETQVEDNNIE